MAMRKAGGRRALEEMFRKRGFRDFKWLDPKKIVVSQWVRMKCTYGCPQYGLAACCPPNAPSVDDCGRFFSEYELAVVFHFQKTMDEPDMRHEWTKKVNARLLNAERDVFLAGHQKAFLLYMDTCHACGGCAPLRTGCRNKKAARPAPEAFAVDVFATVRRLGYPIEVLSNYSKKMNRYAILLID